MSQSLTLTYAIQTFDATGPMRAPYQICKGFVRSGWHVEIITAAGPHHNTPVVAWENVFVHRVQGNGKRLRLMKLMAALLPKRRTHIVMTFLWDWHCFALLASRFLFGSPYVIVLDTYTHIRPTRLLDRVRQEIRYGVILRNASLILAEVPSAFEHAQRYVKGPRVLLVPFCLWEQDLRAIEAQWQQKHYQPQREPVLFYAGRIVERKHLHDLVAAFIRIAAQFPAWTLEIRGPVDSASYGDYVRELAEASLYAERIFFLPPLSGEQLYRRYCETSIYVMPSEGEGFPTTITEAMYFNGAIIAGQSGYVDYQLDYGSCGKLHAPGDVDMLTKHLAQLMNDPGEREALRQRARERMLNLFTWEQYFDLVEHTLRELAVEK